MDHSQNTLTAAVKSLNDGVFPAVDKTDPLATQQLSLVKDYLLFLRSRLPFLHLRAWTELQRAQELVLVLRPYASQIDPELGDAVAESLDSVGSLSLERNSITEVEAGTARLLAVVRETVRGGATAASQVRRAVEAAVVDYDSGMSMFYRAWYLPLGFDPYPAEVPDIADFITG